MKPQQIERIPKPSLFSNPDSLEINLSHFLTALFTLFTSDSCGDIHVRIKKVVRPNNNCSAKPPGDAEFG